MQKKSNRDEKKLRCGMKNDHLPKQGVEWKIEGFTVNLGEGYFSKLATWLDS